MSYLTSFFIHREIVYDEEGNLLDEKPIDANEMEKRKIIGAVWNKIEYLIEREKSLHEGTNFLVSSVMNIDASFDHIAPSSVQTTREEYEGFIGCKIPEQIDIHPPTDIS
jgi:predicted transcriptional regulator YdeE